MTTHTEHAFSNERGFALFYMAVFLTVLLIFVGLAVDTGRAYVVQAQLSKAVDGAALGAARMLNSGNPEQEAGNIYRANFPAGYMGTTSSTSPGDLRVLLDDDRCHDGRERGQRPRHGRRAHDLHEARELHRSSRSTRRARPRGAWSICRSCWTSRARLDGSGRAVRDAARPSSMHSTRTATAVASSSLGTARGSSMPMPAGRGFDKASVMADIPSTLPGGSTNMVEGIYRGWDEIRSVPNGQQSGLRVIVLFTDGASNSVPGLYPGMATSRGLRTYDFPDRSDPDSQTHNDPTYRWTL